MRTFLTIAENIAWIAGIVYSTIPAFWLVVHPFARFWREKRGKIYPMLGLIWLAMWIAAGWITAPYRHERLWPEWSWIGWLMLFVLGLRLYRSLGHFDRDKLFGRSELRPKEHQQALVTSGMHARVRHPIYLAHWLMLTAWTVGAGTIALIALWCFAVVTGVGMIFFEDRELEGRFGEEYRRYKQQVPAIIPKR